MCRSRRELSNEYLLAKICVDKAENEPLEVWGKIIQYYSFVSLYTTRTQERKRADSKLNQAKSNTLTENDSEICATVCNKDDVINLGEYNIDNATTSMMTAIVQPSTKTPLRRPAGSNEQLWI